MRFGNSRLVGLIFLAGMLISCSKSAPEPLGKEYLESNNYQAFKSNADQEHKIRMERKRSFEEQITSTDCDTDRLQIPFKLGQQKLMTFLREIPENCIFNSKNETFYFVGESVKRDQKVRWILLEHEGVYRDQELIAVVFEGEKLRSFKTIAIYKKNPAQTIKTNLAVRDADGKVLISSETNRMIMYPIQQNNSVTTQFTIDSLGNIQENR